jgi:hypothetical protein
MTANKAKRVTINRDYFWKNLTKPVRPLNNSQVEGIDQILSFYEMNPMFSLGGLASYLGQCRTESANTYKPIRERGSRNYFRYLIGRLGIRTMQEAWMFRGWGRIQTTGLSNFIKAIEIINRHYGNKIFKDAYSLGEWLLHPEHNLEAESEYDLINSFTCTSKGLYTGKKMDDYNGKNGFDFFEARRVINPGEIKSRPNTVRLIAIDSRIFYNALKIG